MRLKGEIVPVVHSIVSIVVRKKTLLEVSYNK